MAKESKVRMEEEEAFNLFSFCADSSPSPTRKQIAKGHTTYFNQSTVQHHGSFQLP